MSLQRIYDERVFDDATTDERRARVYVRSGELGPGLDPRADVAIMDALVTRQPPQRLHVVGPSGAGKTSLILRVVADLARRELDIEVPELPADVEEPALALILKRRMERDGIEEELREVIERAAVDDLQILYHERDHDLRSVLKLAHAAGGHALGRGASAVSARDVRSALESTPR